MIDDERVPPPAYHLSALISGHTDDVRAVCVDSSTRIYSGSRDATTRIWEPATESEYVQVGEYQVDQGFVNAVCWMKAPTNLLESKGSLIIGGQDSLISIFDLDSPSSDPIQVLQGHYSNVCALHASASGNTIVSASWDGTARVCGGLVLLIEGVGEAGEDFYITASADKLIKLWKGTIAKIVFKGHTEAVRALTRINSDDNEKASSLFASASNDGSVRIWSFEGDSITVLYGHDSYIYSLISFNGGLASSGEDGIVKIWNDEDGECEQTITVPPLSVWSLAICPNGDLVMGCSDNNLWIFSRDLRRVASAALTMKYDALIAARSLSKSTKATPIIFSPESLSETGEANAIRLVQISSSMVHAYQWEDSTKTWIDLGEVVDPPESVDHDSAAPHDDGKTMYKGELYDFVFSIDAKDDEEALKLPYNLSQDPEEVAVAFIARHSLPVSYMEQIVAFINSNTS